MVGVEENWIWECLNFLEVGEVMVDIDFLFNEDRWWVEVRWEWR